MAPSPLVFFMVTTSVVHSFSHSPLKKPAFLRQHGGPLYLATRTDYSFIDTELRGAAMRLHTKSQAPKEGEAPEKPREPYVPTHHDYLQFLVDSKHVYEALEEIVNEKEDLKDFRNTGLERTQALEKDISFMVTEYGLEQLPVGRAGLDYANKLRSISSIPEFVCHYYNFYFAHTAGGRMIGKQMSSLLLDKKTLEFYKVRKDLPVPCNIAQNQNR